MNTVPNQISATEQQLIADAFSGNRAAFGKLVQMYQVPVYGLCMRYLKGEDARDAAQETFIKAFINRERFSSERAVLPWLLTIAKNLCIDKLRKNRNETPMEAGFEPVSHSTSAEDKIVSKQTLGIVAEEMKRLPEGQREAIVLHHVEGMAYKDISETLGIPQGTVMTWLHRGRKTLQNALKRAE